MPQESGYIVEVSADAGATWGQQADLPAGTTSYQHTELPAGSTRHYRVKAKGNGTTTADSPYSEVKNATTAAPTGYGLLSNVELVLDFEGLQVGTDNAYGTVDASGNVTKLKGIAPGQPYVFDLVGTGLTLNAQGIQASGSGNFVSLLQAEWAFLHQANSQYTIHAVTKFGNVADPNAVYSLLGTNGGTSAKVGMRYAFEDRVTRFNEVIQTEVTNGLGDANNIPFKSNGASGALPANTLAVITQEVKLTTGVLAVSNLWLNNLLQVTSYEKRANIHSSANPTHGLEIFACGGGATRMVGTLCQLVIQKAIETGSTRSSFAAWLMGRAGL